MTVVGTLNKGTKVLYKTGGKEFKAVVGDKVFMNGREKVVLMKSTNRRLGSVNMDAKVTVR